MRIVDYYMKVVIIDQGVDIQFQVAIHRRSTEELLELLKPHYTCATAVEEGFQRISELDAADFPEGQPS